MKLSKKQTEIVTSTARNIVVQSVPAAGKTTCLVERARYLLDHGADPNKMALMTFTNAAAEEMNQRIGGPVGMYIGTIHGYANQLLIRNNFDTSALIEKEDFDAIIELALQHPEVSKEIDYILVDEGQDLTEPEVLFIFDIIKPKSFFIVGDARQSIYGFRGSRPDLFLSFTDMGDVVTYDLNENYRNGRIILNFAKRIIDKIGTRYIDNAIPMARYSGYVYEDDYDLDFLKGLIEEDTGSDYGDWFIIARYNSHVEEIYRFLSKENIPCEIFRRGDMSNSDIGLNLSSNTIKIMTVHAAKGLERKNVIVVGAKYYSDEERRISYVAATRAKQNLYWLKIPNKRIKKAVMQEWE